MFQGSANIYFDHNATTPVCQEVLEALPSIVAAWGNPSSIHWSGRQPKNLLRDARKNVAAAVGVGPLEIIFNSGASEGSNTVIKGVFESYQTSPLSSPTQSTGRQFRNHYMCSSVEHPSVIKTMQHLQSLGARVDFIPVNRDGELDMEFFEAHLCEETALVSVMLANNETGSIFPVAEMAKKAHAVGALFHSDCVQAFGKIPVNLIELGVDYASFSGHKFYSVKGTGFLYVKKNARYGSLIHGGAQERHRRGGTENTLGIGALSVAVQKVSSVEKKSQEMARLRDLMEKRILSEIPEVSVTAGKAPRLPNTSSLVLRGCDGETMLMSLDIKGYAVSTGAACSSGSPEPSPVLMAMGLTRQEAQNSLRVSLGWESTQEQVDSFIEALKVIVVRLRSLESEEGESCHV